MTHAQQNHATAQESSKASAEIRRTDFGDIISVPESMIGAFYSACALIRAAASKGKIKKDFSDMNFMRISARKGNGLIGSACHHEIYDFSADGRKVLVCVREVNATRYGVSTTSKNYFILARHGKGIRVTEANKAKAAKAAKNAGHELGEVLAIVEGKQKLIHKKYEARKGFKFVTKDENGQLISVWDSSSWALNVRRTERSTDNHTGGFYYYANEEEAIAAAEKNLIFAEASSHTGLVLLEVLVEGKEYLIGNNKRCATHITPISIVKEM